MPDGIAIDFPESRKDFFDFNIRLYKKDIVVRNDEDSVNQYSGVFMHPALDIFVMDHFPNSKFRRRIFVLKQQIIFGLAMSKRNSIKLKKYRSLEKIAIVILSVIGNLFSIKSLCKFHDSLSKEYLGKNVDFLYCTGWTPEYPGWVYSKKQYDKVHLTEFEGEKFYVIDEYEEVLSYDYGDWREPVKTHDHEQFVKNL